MTGLVSSPGMREVFEFHSSCLIILALSGGILLAGCDVISPPTACTHEFVTHSLQVSSPDGQPADSVDITVRNVDSDKVYDVCEDLSFSCDYAGNMGEYVVFHDGLEVSTDGDNVVVTGQKDSLNFEAQYIFRRGECHVRKVEGPEEVRLSVVRSSE